MSELLRIENLKIHYPIRSGFFNKVTDHVYAVDDVNFSIEEGQTYGLVGESGSGKTTIGKAIVGLEAITGGKIIYKGEDVSSPATRKKMEYNRDVQMIFQDSQSSLNPRKTIYEIISEPIRNFDNLDEEATKKRVAELLDIVGLPQRTMYQYPFQFSGGQRQRIGIARAISTNPKLIVADEPVSALDLSVQAQVLNFMKKIQKELGISFLFISHDLGVVRHMTENIAIMHNGRFAEIGPRDEIFNNPQHIYTKRLLAAIPSMDVNKREENTENRKKVEAEFQASKSEWYEPSGRLLPNLVEVSPSHWAALPEANSKGEQK